MKTIIAGSRGTTMDDVWTAMDNCPWEVTSVVSGCARGADKFGERWAAMEGLNVHHFPADWDSQGKSAGYIRNAEMAKNAEACVVVWDGSSLGSEHMIEQAKYEGLKLFIWYCGGTMQELKECLVVLTSYFSLSSSSSPASGSGFGSHDC